MSNLIDPEKILARAYVGIVTDALKKGDKRTDNIIRCCKCGRCDVTLRKLHDQVYACTDCINKRAAEEVLAERKKMKK